MNDTQPKAWLCNHCGERGELSFLIVCLFLVALTGIVASTAIRIEWYNHAVGGFMPRPQPPSIEGNDITWRTTSPDMAELSYRRGLAYEAGVVLSDDELMAMPLTPLQAREVDRIRRHTKLNSEFRALVSSMGLLQYPLVGLGLCLSFWAVRDNRRTLGLVGRICLAIHLIAGGLMFYRGYFSSLGL